MNNYNKTILIKLIKIIILVIFFFTSNSLANNTLGDNSGKPLPRFISIKSSEANLRVGPNKDYPIILKYTYKNLPLMVIDEFDKWRKVVDWENNVGWIHLSLLSNKRFGIINKKINKYASVYSKPDHRLIGQVGSGNIVRINKCIDIWCEIKVENYKGWTKKTNIWGTFKDEVFN